MIWPYLLLAVVAGAMIPFQAGANAELSHWLGSPIRGAFVSFVVGALALLALSLVVRSKPLPSVSKLGQTPWWVWIGGLLGAFYIAGSAFIAPRLGAVLLIAAGVAGQSLASVLVDQFGLVGFKEHHISAGRVAGILFVGTGVALVRVF